MLPGSGSTGFSTSVLVLVADGVAGGSERVAVRVAGATGTAVVAAGEVAGDGSVLGVAPGVVAPGAVLGAGEDEPTEPDGRGAGVLVCWEQPARASTPTTASAAAIFRFIGPSSGASVRLGRSTTPSGSRDTRMWRAQFNLTK
jgi:hypothetical protein